MTTLYRPFSTLHVYSHGSTTSGARHHVLVSVQERLSPVRAVIVVRHDNAPLALGRLYALGCHRCCHDIPLPPHTFFVVETVLHTGDAVVAPNLTSKVTSTQFLIATTRPIGGVIHKLHHFPRGVTIEVGGAARDVGAEARPFGVGCGIPVSPEVLNREVGDSTEVTGGVDRRSPERHVVVIQTNLLSIVGQPVVVVPNKQTGEEVEIQTLEDDGRHI